MKARVPVSEPKWDLYTLAGDCVEGGMTDCARDLRQWGRCYESLRAERDAARDEAKAFNDECDRLAVILNGTQDERDALAGALRALEQCFVLDNPHAPLSQQTYGVIGHVPDAVRQARAALAKVRS